MIEQGWLRKKLPEGGVSMVILLTDGQPLTLGFYSEVASPLLAEVNIHYPETAVNSLTNHHFKQLNDLRLLWPARLSDNDLDNFLVEVSAQG
ncbi:hypothetical protein AAFF_G00276070 [Aldrovandia affinis]|uniref:Uncharacterized protein n=1 Tax=Aldrovandia affinis TaxID=143900 RepID=A0AAD7W262_9TELE|nr:hypothetical protein AAFF_G00276070 [Aldrovandia affinis]